MLKAGCLTGWCALRQPLRLKKPLNLTLIPLITLLNSGGRRLRAAGTDMTMQYDLNRINTLTASDLEFIRQQGEDARRALSDAVTGLLSTPEGWRVCAEYRSEFGGFFPVQCRFSADGSDDWHLCVCSPGEVSPYWLLVLLSSGGEVVRTLYQSDTLQPERINQLIAQLAGMRRFNCTARTVAKLMNVEVTA